MSSGELLCRSCFRPARTGCDGSPRYQDTDFPPEQATLLASAFKDANVDHRVEIWEGAAHGWTMRDIYNEVAAERHFHELVALFKETLLPRGLHPLDPAEGSRRLQRADAHAPLAA